jgi:hypothetical protein
MKSNTKAAKGFIAPHRGLNQGQNTTFEGHLARFGLEFPGKA